MKPGANLSSRFSIFQCNRHQIDWTSSINICAISRKRTSALFSNKPTRPAGGVNPPLPKKKKKKNGKRIIILLHVSKIEEKTRHWFLLHPF